MVSSEAAFLRWVSRWLCPVLLALYWPKYPFLKRIQVRSHFVATIFTYLLPYRLYSNIWSQSGTLELEHINFQGTHLSPYHRVRWECRRNLGVQLRGIPSTMVGSCLRQRQESSMMIINWLSLFVWRKISPPRVQRRVREKKGRQLDELAKLRAQGHSFSLPSCSRKAASDASPRTTKCLMALWALCICIIFSHAWNLNPSQDIPGWQLPWTNY